MNIFFCNISSQVRPEDIYHYVLEGLKTFGVCLNIPPIDKCEVLEIYDKNEKKFQYHGVVIFRDPNAGQRAMRKLKGSLLKGEYVEMREFYRRSVKAGKNPENRDNSFVKVCCTQTQFLENQPTNVITKRQIFCPATAA